MGQKEYQAKRAVDVLANPDDGVAEFMEDLKAPELVIEGFQVEAVHFYKNMADSHVLSCKVTYEIEGLRKQLLCRTGFDQVVEAVQSCGYDLDPVMKHKVFVQYGSWDPTVSPGLYKIRRRADYDKLIDDPWKVRREIIKEQNMKRKEMEAAWGLK